MPVSRNHALCVAAALSLTSAAARAVAPATQPAASLPHIQVDIEKKQVRVQCQAVKADYPLEFLAVVTNGNEYEALVRTDAKPSHVHLALLMLGLKPGTPVRFSEETKTWLAPEGPGVQISFEYEQAGKVKKVPAYSWMRDIRTKVAVPAFAWVFTGSHLFEDGSYGGDIAACVVGVLNNEMSVLDTPQLKGRAMETREWERNPDVMAATGTVVTMILEPAVENDAATRPSTPSR